VGYSTRLESPCDSSEVSFDYCLLTQKSHTLAFLREILAAVFVGILIAFFWEGIGGAIVALVALAMQVDVIVNAGGGLNPFILVFVFDGLAFVSCWWLTWRRTRRQSLSKDTPKLSPPPVHERGIQSHRWRLFTQLTVVVLLVAGLTWRVVLQLQPPPPPPADCGQPADAARSGAVAQFCFPKLTPQFGQGSMTAGPDGSVWFTEGQKIARITPAGALTEFPVPPPDVFITAGPDGNLWFSAQPGKIRRITPSGAVTLFPLPPKAQIGGLAAGSDGRVWFLRSDTDTSGIFWWTQIGRITP
jgi:hypothetical protein